MDTIIIGAGLFGQTICSKLREEGRKCLLIDAQRHGAGSIPAACLMKPSWFSGLGPDVYNPALETLDSLFGVEDLQFKVGLGSATVHWVMPSKILTANMVTRAEVSEVHQGRIVIRDGTVIEAKTIIVAAGVWTRELVRFHVEGQSGTAFLAPKMTIKQPFISPWAPYRQLVAFNRGDGLWVGDGTSIRMGNWTQENEDKSRERCSKAIGIESQPQLLEPLYGIRPYIKGVKHAAVQEVMPGVWVATGGAKNGTLGAGYSAWFLSQKLS